MTALFERADGTSLRVARPGDGYAVRHLLALADPDRPETVPVMASVIDQRAELVATMKGWGQPHAVVATDATGAFVGVVMAVPNYEWLSEFATQLTKQELKDVSKQFLYITTLAVDPNHRRRQLGRDLVTQIESILRTEGCAFVAADYNPDPETAAFWEAVGYDTGDSVPNREMLLTITGDNRALQMVCNHGYSTAVKVLDPDVGISAL